MLDVPPTDNFRTITMNKHTPGESTSTTSIKDSVQTFVDQGAEAVDAIKSRVAAVTDEAKAKSSDAYDALAKLIKDNPLKSLAIAFGIGYVAMRIRTSKLTKVALIGGLGYLGTRMFRK